MNMITVYLKQQTRLKIMFIIMILMISNVVSIMLILPLNYKNTQKFTWKILGIHTVLLYIVWKTNTLVKMILHTKWFHNKN